MKNVILLAVISLLFLSGCASQKSYPRFALEQPEEGVTTVHPDVLEKTEVGHSIVTFTAIMPPQFLVEVKYGVKGVWPLVAGHKTDETKPLKDGFCYSVESRAFDKNPLGIIPMNCTMIGTRKELSEYRFALVNKDGGVWISSIAGGDMLDDRSWDFQDFEDNFEHRTEVLGKIGQTLDEIDQFWIATVAAFGVTLEADVVEIPISKYSVLWQNYRRELISEMGYELTMPNGDVVVSNFSRDDMVDALSHNPRITAWQKFASRLSIPIGTPEIIALGVGSSILNGGIAAMIDDEWQSRVARGTGQYRDSAQQMSYLMSKYQQSHMKLMKYKFAYYQKGE